MRSKRKWIVAGLALAGAGILLSVSLVIGGLVAFAQTPTPPARNPAAALQNLGDLFWQKLAARLNVTVDKLHQEVNAAMQDTIQQEVQDGKLTADQAKRLQDRMQQQGHRGFMPGFPLPGLGPQFGEPLPKGRDSVNPRGMGQNMLDAVAKILGMTTDEVRQALQKGQGLGQLADGKGVSRDAVIQVMRNALKADVDQMLGNGRITQQQADQMKARIDAQTIDLNNTRLNPSIQPGQRFRFAPNRRNNPGQKF
ncbi:MAG: hypothetical protein EXR62_05610 [Chloroflexi bacterium]|nr:hypothetical protein [Chloroflexota bacterium]